MPAMRYCIIPYSRRSAPTSGCVMPVKQTQRTRSARNMRGSSGYPRSPEPVHAIGAGDDRRHYGHPGSMTSLALAAHAAAPPFNANFYIVAATVIPVLFLALTFQGTTIFERTVRAFLSALRTSLDPDPHQRARSN